MLPSTSSSTTYKETNNLKHVQLQYIINWAHFLPHTAVEIKSNNGSQTFLIKGALKQHCFFQAHGTPICSHYTAYKL
jgi:hypothetical protein